MKTPLATLTWLGDKTGGASLFRHSPGLPGMNFAALFQAQMVDGINGAVQGLPPATDPLGAVSVSVANVPLFEQSPAPAVLSRQMHLIPGSVAFASETPEHPVLTDSEAAIPPAADWQPASPEIDSGAPDVSEVQEETLSQIDDTQVVDTGTTGNLQAEEETMNTPVVETAPSSSAHSTVRQKQNESFLAETSFDRLLDQQVANRQQEQRNLDRQSAARSADQSKPQASNTQPDSEDQANAVAKEAQARAHHMELAQAVTPEDAAHAIAMQQALAMAEAMRPSDIPASLPADAALIAQAAVTAKSRLAAPGGNDIAQDADATGAAARATASGSTTLVPVDLDTDTMPTQGMEKSPAGAFSLAGIQGQTSTVSAPALAPATPQPPREAVANRPDASAVSGKHPALAPTTAQLAAQQAKADTNAGTSQDPQQFQAALASGSATANTNAPATESFTSAFSTIITASTPVAANGMPQAIAGQHMPGANNHSARLAPHVGHPGWSQALGQHVVMMAGNAQHTATLTLNPPDLGPMQVVLQVQNSQADATFVTAQPEVKQALEAALPRLREMMEQAGIELGQATVNTGSPQQQAGQEQSGRNQGTHVATLDADSNDVSTMLAMPPSAGTMGRGMVDIFA